MNVMADPQVMAFDDLITRILARFASGTTAEADRAIQTSLGELSEFVGVDYAFVVRTAADLSSWSVAYEWCSPRAPSRMANYQRIPMGSWGFNERVLLSGEVLQLNGMQDVPGDSSDVRSYMESLGFRSTLQVPTRRPGGQISGCIALVSLTHEMAWSPADIRRLRLAGEAIASAIERAEVEKQLQESEARYRATFQQAPVGILNITRDGRLIRANQYFREMLGYTELEMLDRHYSEFTHSDDVDTTADLYQELLAAGVLSHGLEKRYRRKDGTVVWGKLMLSLLSGVEPASDSIVATIEDITARKQADEIFDAVPDLVFVTDRQQRVVRTNQATAERLGRAREDILGCPCHEIIRAGTASESCSHVQLAMDGVSHRFETHEPHLKGHFLVSCTPLRDARGELTGTVHVARDVTDLRRSEAALRQAHEKLQQRRALVVAASLDGVWEWDAATDVVQYSDRFAELLGYTSVEVTPTLDFFRGVLHPDDSEQLWSAVERHLSEGIPYDVECRLRTKSGVYRWFRTRGQAQRDPNGRPTWMAGSLQDIDQQKRAETELRIALEEVERLSEQLRAENIYLQEEITTSLGFDEVVGESAPWRGILRQIEHVATTNASVLLLGETGTGKELLARAIHDRSPRKERPLVKVNLAALPSSLIESELFGHVKGAFTGAVADKIGRFQLADGGTLFLDEIGELDPELQTKLLRVLQEGEFERIGSPQTHQVDVRIVAATNRDLRGAMEEGRFRPDLYYRLAVFPIDVPPLRLRRDDIPLLTWHFIAKKQGRLGKTIRSIPAHVMQALVDYDWPGNVRELENVIERAMILTSTPVLDLPEVLTPVVKTAHSMHVAPCREIDRAAILAALEACGGKIKGAGNAAERLGLKPSTLRYRMKTLGIQRP